VFPTALFIYAFLSEVLFPPKAAFRRHFDPRVIFPCASWNWKTSLFELKGKKPTPPRGSLFLSPTVVSLTPVSSLTKNKSPAFLWLGHVALQLPCRGLIARYLFLIFFSAIGFPWSWTLIFPGLFLCKTDSPIFFFFLFFVHPVYFTLL